MEGARGAPPFTFELYRTTHDAWRVFRHHHYLSTELNDSAACFVATVDGRPAAFASTIFFVHDKVKDAYREHRTVTLPDFQGVGLGNRVSEYVAALYRGGDFRYFSTTSHPAMIAHRHHSPLWRTVRLPSIAPAQGRTTGRKSLKRFLSTNRITASFEYIGPPGEQTLSLAPTSKLSR